MELFITAKTNITDKNSLEWKYYANLSKADIVERWHTPIGKGLLASLQAGRLSRSTLEQHIGQFNHKFDLRGIPLSGVDCSGLDLSDIDFFAADLSKAIFTGAKLSNSYLSECDIRGAVFDWAKFDGALLDHVKFDRNTSLLGVNINEVNFTLSTLLYDLALSQQRIQQLEQYYPVFSLFLRWSCDYGRSFILYLFWVVVFIFGYASTYCVLMDISFLDSVYFSIVTFATVGYGDIAPHEPLQKIIVCSEILIGYLMGGLLVAILAKRVMG